jgi:HSP20 family molecular chaperone IbpA
MFDSFFDAAPNLVRRSTEGYPVTDIYKDDDGNSIIECALAGFTKDQLSVEVKDGRITITADGGAFVAPDNKLDMSSAHASFENGLLRVIVPPTPEAQPVSINIS